MKKLPKSLEDAFSDLVVGDSVDLDSHEECSCQRQEIKTSAGFDPSNLTFGNTVFVLLLIAMLCCVPFSGEMIYSLGLRSSHFSEGLWVNVGLFFTSILYLFVVVDVFLHQRSAFDEAVQVSVTSFCFLLAGWILSGGPPNLLIWVFTIPALSHWVFWMVREGGAVLMFPFWLITLTPDCTGLAEVENKHAEEEAPH